MQLRTQTSSAAARGARGVIPAARVAAGARALRVAPRATQEVDTITGVVFEPFQAVKAEMELVSNTKAEQSSFARVNFHPECEAALNEQINIEYNVSYIYHALYAYFDRDNVALPGMAAYFKAGSEEEREHAEVLMQYQNQRGGRVKLKSILMPEMEFNHPEKGDALYAMELALSLEKLNFQKLRALHAVASKHEDASMSDFVEGQLLGEQVEAVKKVSEYVAQLRRVGKGLGVYQFDQALLEEVGKA